jgi:hypothetical protein
MSGSRRASFLALGLVLSCGAPPPVSPETAGSARPVSAPVPAAAPAGFDGGAGAWIARDQGVRFMLPDRAGWSEVESRDWLVIENRRARATLRLRLARAARLVSPEECLEDARLRDPKLPALRDEEVFERRALVAPDHFDGGVVLGVREAGPSVQGIIVASGAAVGRCYVAVFESSASGAARESVVAARLRAMIRSLDSVEVPSVEDRLGR